MSDRDLTGYDSTDAATGRADEEVYLYDAATAELVCASCDPTGARPVGEEYTLQVKVAGGNRVWSESSWLAATVPGWTPFQASIAQYQSDYLSNTGRLFFNSHDALVPRDVNGTWDVYEYEPEGVPVGGHGCSSASGSGSEVFEPARTAVIEGRRVQSGAGCVGLISSGSSAEESAFLDASETGGDVFFLTTAKLAPQDFDNAFDIYDAHECTSESPCVSPPGQSPPACETAEACRGVQAPQSAIFGSPPSATFNGQGNLAGGQGSNPPGGRGSNPKKVTKKTVRCKKGFVKNKHGKCVRRVKSKKRVKRANRGGK
jgi:hypothetical protein